MTDTNPLDRVSPRQAREVEAEIVAALQGNASHGHHAEIYQFRLLEYSSSLVDVERLSNYAKAELEARSMERDQLEEAAFDSAAALTAIVTAVATRTGHDIRINGIPPQEWFQRVAHGLGWHRALVGAASSFPDRPLMHKRIRR